MKGLKQLMAQTAAQMPDHAAYIDKHNMRHLDKAAQSAV
jgi:hypothetical protein